MKRFAVCTWDHNKRLHKVQCIKGIRGLTGLGLRDSKIIVDKVYAGTPQDITIMNTLSDHQANEYINLASSGGLVITLVVVDTPVRREIAYKLNEVLSYATISGQTDIVFTLKNLLKHHLPREF